ncbi:MAG: hypothetical protein IJ068_04495 [Bacilli bacterium]|nr:hypothetical protein [Bacilli bacterium]
MKYITNNHERFPENVLEIQVINVDDNKYIVYPFRFRGLYDLYNYLNSNPKINYEVWSKNNLASINGEFSFAGDAYEDALKSLLGDVDPGYQEFLKVENKVNANLGRVHKYEKIRTVAGGHVNVPLYASGSPFIYEASRVINKPKFITVNIALSYFWGTSKSQVFNRAIIITNIVKALEKAGYSVNINAFELSSESNELFKMIFEIKHFGEKINYQAMYKSLCRVEFLRRLCFRVLETSDVKEDWEHGYGSTCGRNFTKKVLKLKKDDLYFDQPREMDIYGRNLVEDFENAADYLKLSNIIDVEREKNKFKENVKVLKKNLKN